jgi:hypothetical protein
MRDLGDLTLGAGRARGHGAGSDTPFNETGLGGRRVARREMRPVRQLRDRGRCPRSRGAARVGCGLSSAPPIRPPKSERGLVIEAGPARQQHERGAFAYGRPVDDQTGAFHVEVQSGVVHADTHGERGGVSPTVEPAAFLLVGDEARRDNGHRCQPGRASSSVRFRWRRSPSRARQSFVATSVTSALPETDWPPAIDG